MQHQSGHHQLRGHFDLVEKVRRRASKNASEVREMSYGKMIMARKLHTLEGRRKRRNRIITYKLPNRFHEVNIQRFFKI